MANCKNCGRQVSSWDVNSYGLCTQCTQERTRQEREDLVRLLGNGPIRCQLALTDFVTVSGFNLVYIGDLFASESCLAFITLAGNIKQDFLNTQTLALEARKNDFGLTLEDRIRHHGGTVIPKQDIISVSMPVSEGKPKTGLVIEYKGGLLNLGNDKAPEYYNKLVEWQQGTLKEDVDTQGANLYLGYPSVDKFVSWLVNGQLLSEIDQSKLAEIASRTNYLQNILRSFENLKFQQKVACLSTVFTLSTDWINAFRKYLIEKKQVAWLTVFGSGLFGFLLIAGGIYYVSNVPLSFDTSFLGLLLFFIIFLILIGVALAINFQSIGELNRLLALFHHHGNK